MTSEAVEQAPGVQAETPLPPEDPVERWGSEALKAEWRQLLRVRSSPGQREHEARAARQDTLAAHAAYEDWKADHPEATLPELAATRRRFRLAELDGLAKDAEGIVAKLAPLEKMKLGRVMERRRAEAEQLADDLVVRWRALTFRLLTECVPSELGRARVEPAPGVQPETPLEAARAIVGKALGVLELAQVPAVEPTHWGAGVLPDGIGLGGWIPTLRRVDGSGREPLPSPVELFEDALRTPGARDLVRDGAKRRRNGR
jgi:hypothetical protein